jgi:hypothetical protein
MRLYARNLNVRAKNEQVYPAQRALASSGEALDLLVKYFKNSEYTGWFKAIVIGIKYRMWYGKHILGLHRML